MTKYFAFKGQKTADYPAVKIVLDQMVGRYEQLADMEKSIREHAGNKEISSYVYDKMHVEVDIPTTACNKFVVTNWEDEWNESVADFCICELDHNPNEIMGLIIME